MSEKISKIAVFTSGGDAPGMNACVRAVTRAAIANGVEVMGILNGYDGMIDGNLIPLPSHSVSNIIQRGGTILKAGRSKRFLDIEYRKQAFEQLKAAGVEAVVANGGDGTFRGALEFTSEHPGIPFIGIPGTIDNDMYGTDLTIGYDTAINTAIDAIDKIRDTAASHNRLFFIEVMGRDAGLIALRCGIASGAEAILIPEEKTDIDELIQTLEAGKSMNKSSSIVIVAEGDDAGGAFKIAEKVKEKFNYYDTRVSILGHLQRGGSPSCMDRVLASRLGVAAVEAIMAGKRQIMVGQVNNEIVETPFENATKHHLEINKSLMHIARVLSGSVL